MEEFFYYIKEKCTNEEEYAYEVLMARGFLLEDKRFVISDNSHNKDGEYLNRLLKKYNIGEVDGRIIKLTDIAGIENLYKVEDCREGEAVDYGYNWKVFRQRHHGHKVYVFDLEPFVARYIKSISACGINTWLSCDGNHQNSSANRIVIETSGGGSKVWHEILCTRFLKGQFILNWDKEFSKIKFNNKTKWKTYIELNKAAEFLYTNRIILRYAKDKAMKKISKSMIKHKSPEEINDMFINSVNKILDKIQINEISQRKTPIQGG